MIYIYMFIYLYICLFICSPFPVGQCAAMADGMWYVHHFPATQRVKVQGKLGTQSHLCAIHGGLELHASRPRDFAGTGWGGKNQSDMYVTNQSLGLSVKYGGKRTGDVC